MLSRLQTLKISFKLLITLYIYKCVCMCEW